MRVGIVIDDVDRRRGGMSEWCWQFVNSAAARKHALHVIAQGFGEDLLPTDVVQHRLPQAGSRVAFAQAASSAIRDLKLDVVHDMGLGLDFDIFQPHGGSYAAWLGRRLDMYPAWIRGIKRSIDAWLPRQRDFAQHGQMQTAALARGQSQVIAISNMVAESFTRLQGVRPDRIEVIYNGVDCSRYSPAHRAQLRAVARRKLGLADETVLLLLAAHNFRLKGVPELLATARRLLANGRPVHVAIAGGKRLAKWRHFANRLGLAGRVSFLGTVADMIPLYAAADAYVHPTYYDPCSLVLLEAAASGLPIITTRRFNGAAELFREGEEILTINDPTDGDALYERADAVFDERIREALGAAARQVALRNPIERNIANIVALYGDRSRRQLAA